MMNESKSLKDYLVKPGEKSPFANLLVDLAFKKAFDPDKSTSRENLVNLLNDLLAPQLKRPIKNVWTRNVAKNLSGSNVSRSAFFDLHCEDDAGELVEIEVQIRQTTNFLKRLAFYASEMVANQAEHGVKWNYDVKPTYVIAITRHSVFDDDRIIHRASTIDLETGEQFVDSYNFTVVELLKVPFFFEESSDSLSKWLFFFRFLSRLRELPAVLNERKFKLLTESSKVSNFNKTEFEAYLRMYHEEFDHNAIMPGLFEEFADEINAKVEERTRERVDERNREIAKSLVANGKLSDEEIAACSGLSVEDVGALRNQIQSTPK